MTVPQELIKVRGFQVAPAELEGHLLEHRDVADACVVGLPDEYSGELPLAFIVLTAKALERVKGNPGAEAALKETLKRVCTLLCQNFVLMQPFSMFPTRRFITRSWLAVSCL